MSKPKHTPGPWFVERLDSMRHMEIAENTPVVTSGKYPNVFSHVVCLGGDKTAIANARLIAAAPELLSELTALFELYKDDLDNDTDGHQRRVRIERLLYKAKGNTNE